MPVDLALRDEVDAALAHHRDVEAGAAHVDRRRCSASPSSWPSSAQAALPPEGPDSSRRTGCCAAVSRLHTPPFDCTSGGAGGILRPACARPACRDRPDTTGISRALSTVVDVRSYSRISGLSSLEQRDRQRRPRRLRSCLRPLLMLRVEIRVEQADRDRLDVQLIQLRDQPLERAASSAASRRCHRPYALRACRSGGRAGSGRAGIGIERIDLAPIVAADLQHVLEPRRRHQRAPRQLALQHRIGGDGRCRAAGSRCPRARSRSARAASLMPVIRPSEGSSGVVGVFRLVMAPVRASKI